MDSQLVRNAYHYERYLRARRAKYSPPSGVGLEPRVLRLRRHVDRASRKSFARTVERQAVHSLTRVRHPRRFYGGEASVSG